jgi:hypothetical protein
MNNGRTKAIQVNSKAGTSSESNDDDREKRLDFFSPLELIFVYGEIIQVWSH